MSARWYGVATPEWDDTSYPYPPEPGREFLYVCARNAKRAKVLAVRALRRQKRDGWIGWESNNPYAGDWQVEALDCERHLLVQRRLRRMRRRTTTPAPDAEPGGGR